MGTQQNGTILVEGDEVSWDAVRLPLMSEAVLRASSVFDGLLVRWSDDRMDRVLVAGRRHVERLHDGCTAQGLGWRWSADDVEQWCLDAADREAAREGTPDVYVRPMVVQAQLRPDQKHDTVLIVAAFGQASRLVGTPRRVMTVPWRRPPSASLPATVKSVANYSLTRLARLQAAAAGYDDAILLNEQGRVAEGAGAALVVDLDGELVTPPPWESCLPSITVDAVVSLCAAEGITFRHRPVLPAQLRSSRGACLVGTLSPLDPVVKLDFTDLPVSPTLAVVADLYTAASTQPGHRYRDLLIDPVPVNGRRA